MRGRINNLEAKSEEDLITLVAFDGEEMKVPGDATIRVIATLWKMGRGEDPEDPLAERLVREGYRGWREKDPGNDVSVLSLAARLRESRRRAQEEDK